MELIQLHKMFKFFTLLLTIMFATQIKAVEVKDLYQASVPVNSQSTTERKSALVEAMKAVMLKVSGQESVLEHPEIKRAAIRYNSYITQYKYVRVQPADKRKSSYLTLVATFDEAKINQLFQQTNLAIWGRLRPQILVWLIEEDTLSREIISDSSQSLLPEHISQFSQKRALPMTLPLMDLEDATHVNLSDLWGRFVSPTKQMSSRYFPDAILTIRVSNSSLLPESDFAQEQECELVVCKDQTTYVMDWMLISEQQYFGQSYQGLNQEELLAQVLSEVSSKLHQRYALSTALKNEYVVDIANVDSFANYVALMDFLSGLSSVESATLVSAQGENRRIKLSLLGSKQALLASLALNQQLNEYVDPLAPRDASDIPVFFWSAK